MNKPLSYNISPGGITVARQPVIFTRVPYNTGSMVDELTARADINFLLRTQTNVTSNHRNSL
jgi:hypothetical protein